MSEDMFDKFLRTESVFKNQQTLNQAWVPSKEEKLLCRDAELKRLIAIHRPIIETNGEFSTNTLVLGNGGIGKTVAIRYFGRRFREAALKEGIEFKAEYYDCLQHRSKSSILRHLSEKLHYLGGHGYSDNEIMGQILKALKARNRSLLIILDEVHNLSPDDILALLNSSIGFGEKNTRFCIICITRPTDWYKVDNEKISSRIQETIRMESYNHEEAFEILKYRRNLAFRSGIVEDDVVELIAEMTVENKNMRIG
ncbi:MAG: Cdc6/Cdc18 family protein, partial [Promethearchaeota archaeon]